MSSFIVYHFFQKNAIGRVGGRIIVSSLSKLSFGNKLSKYSVCTKIGSNILRRCKFKKDPSIIFGFTGIRKPTPRVSRNGNRENGKMTSSSSLQYH